METWMNCSLEENECLLRFQTARPSEAISFRNPKSTGKKAVPMKKKNQNHERGEYVRNRKVRQESISLLFWKKDIRNP